MKSKVIMEKIHKRYEKIPEKSKQEKIEMEGIKQVIEDFEELESLKESGVVEINKLKSENFNLNQKLTDKNLMIEKQSQIIDDLNERIRLLENAAKARTEQVQNLQKENQELRNQNSDWSRHVKTYIKENLEYMKENEQYKKANAFLGGMLRDKLQENHSLERELKTANDRMLSKDKLINLCDEIEKDSKLRIKSLKAKIEELESQLKSEQNVHQELAGLQEAFKILKDNFDFKLQTDCDGLTYITCFRNKYLVGNPLVDDEILALERYLK